ncbi:hypothetical protein AVEN_25419-1 [Araneus ventricosus]|uniref:Uncharacterized protein n=1 Tax=Araneus ventricosus TaxID=182803 RepID=A0A4Y2IA63_ARAVE|nr:hypothetical protein AVEN_25419-1 [Araneus ventricosus]
MASQAAKQCEHFEKDALFVGRFVYDVLVYTLTKSGLPETSLPTTDCTENVYHHANFMTVAGASVLRISLVMRDKWKQMFISRRNSYGFSTENVLDFLVQLVICCPLSRTSHTKSLVELLLASCNEIMMYFHLESMDINFNFVMKSITVDIIGIIGLNQKYSENIEELFDSFDDISGYTEWITDFIAEFAIPYGSRDDVSDLFFERVRKQFKDDLKKLKDRFGFLPYDRFSAITVEGSENLAKPLSITSDSESPEPPKLLASSQIGAEGGKNSRGNQSTRSENVSERFAQSNRSTKISSELGIEHDLRKMSLDAEEASQEIHGAITKGKTARNEKDNGKKKES